MAASILWNIRLPRIITALLLGASLSGSGIILQTVMGNPLIEPGIWELPKERLLEQLQLFLFPGKNYISIYLSAILFSLLGILLTWILSKKIKYGGNILRTYTFRDYNLRTIFFRPWNSKIYGRSQKRSSGNNFLVNGLSQRC